MFRELDQRISDGLTVTLRWESDTGTVWISCEDQRTPNPLSICYAVDPSDARRAFIHPFAYP